MPDAATRHGCFVVTVRRGIAAALELARAERLSLRSSRCRTAMLVVGLRGNRRAGTDDRRLGSPPEGLRATDSTRSPRRLTSCRHRRELATHTAMSPILFLILPWVADVGPCDRVQVVRLWSTCDPSVSGEPDSRRYSGSDLLLQRVTIGYFSGRLPDNEPGAKPS